MNAWQDWSRNERRGNYAMFTGVLMTAILGFSAFAVDISLITLAELQAQSTADAASHAALVAFRQNKSTAEGNTAATWMVNYNKVATGHATIDGGYPKYGTWDYTTATFTPGLTVGGNANAVEVAVSREGTNTLDLLLAPILGVNTHDVHADSITAQQLRAVMVVIDMSCSMMGTYPAAVDANRSGALAFLDYFEDNPQEGDLLGMSMFARYANLTPTATNPTGTAVTANSPGVAQRPWAPITEIETGQIQGSTATPNPLLLRQRYMGICNTSSGTQCRIGPAPTYGLVSTGGTLVYHPTTGSIGSNTNPQPAVVQASNELVAFTDDRYFRGIVFMSDGLPNAGGGAGGAQTAATNAWNNDIHIWSILYHNGSFDPSFMQSMVRGIGYYLASPNAADLPAMYEQVAKSIPTALVQ